MSTAYEVRNLASGDLALLAELQQELPTTFDQPGPHLLDLKLCSDLHGDACLVAFEGSELVACVLGFVCDREGYCTTLAVRPGFSQSDAVTALLARFAAAMSARVDTCWISVSEGDNVARSLCRMLGAHRVGVRVAYGGGDDHISARIDRARGERMQDAAAGTLS